ncbi:MAG: hypothetical protein WC562_07865 [Dehalococcoidia bacterium]
MDNYFWSLLGGEVERQPDLEVRVLADSAGRKASGLKGDIDELRQTIDKLVLITRALWEIIAESRGLNDEYLINKVNEIDLRDGTLDGKMKTSIKKCPSCGRTMSQSRGACLYCGTKDTEANPFDRINTDSRKDLTQWLM